MIAAARWRLIGCASLMAFSSIAHAAPSTPGAGNLMQQIRPNRAPTPSHSNTGLLPAHPQAGTSASKVRFAVRQIVITGNTLFASSTLHALVAGGEGKRQTLGDLQRLAQRITDYYHAHGYSLSRAVIPAQTVKQGVIHFEVIEARFGKITLHNQSRVRSRLLEETLTPLQRGQIVADRPLDRSLLLLSDIPGVSSSASLKPGTRVGTSDLDVDVAALPPVTGNVTADDYGNQYTGRVRAGADVAVNDPLHLGDALDLYLLSSGKGLDYGRAAYDVVVNGSGTSVGASYSMMHYALGGTLTSLHALGTAKVASGWMRQPLLRSLTLNLYAQAQLDNKRLRDHIDSTAVRTDRHLSDISFSVSGDIRDHLLPTAAVNTFNATWTAGSLGFDDPAALAADARTARTAGHFSLWSAALTRLQGIDRRDSLYLSVSGQWTHNNLDSVEKLAVGGPYGLRGYDMGVLSADTGYLGTVELRRRFDARIRGKAFVDGEHVKVNVRPWSAGRNTDTLSDVGLGLDVNMPHHWYLQADLAHPVGSVPASLSSTLRAWVELSKAF